MKQQIPIDAEMIAHLRALRGKMTNFRFAGLLGVSAPTLLAALAGERLQPGTRALLSMRIRELTAGNVAQVETGAAA